MATAIFNGYGDTEIDGGSPLDDGDVFTVPAQVSRTFVVNDPGGTVLNGDNDDNEESDDESQWVEVNDTDGVEATGLLYAEYELTVRDSSFNFYTLIFMEIEGTSRDYYAWSGPAPPPGTSLLVTDRDSTVSAVPYSSFNYAPGVVCFGAGMRILTPSGLRAVETLTPGMKVIARNTRPLDILWVGEMTPQITGPRDKRRPICLRAGRVDDRRPFRDLLLSPQHRILLRGPSVRAHMGHDKVLAPVCGLTDLPGIGRGPRHGQIRYVHILLESHAVVYAEGIACESLWPGAECLKNLPTTTARHLASLTGNRPGYATPALPFATRGQTRKMVATHLAKDHETHRLFAPPVATRQLRAPRAPIHQRCAG